MMEIDGGCQTEVTYACVGYSADAMKPEEDRVNTLRIGYPVHHPSREKWPVSKAVTVAILPSPKVLVLGETGATCYKFHFFLH